MTDQGYALFDTAIGRCGIAWGRRGIRAVTLPEASDAASRARLRARAPQAEEMLPPPGVQAAIDAIVALLRGEPADLGFIALDLDGLPDFHRRVYREARRIGPGETLTYGALGARAGAPQGARAVGQALGRNPFPIVVPCHRVLAAGGKLGGFSAEGGLSTKLRLLTIEGAEAPLLRRARPGP